MRREEDRIERRIAALRARGRIHVDAHVGRARGVIEARVRAMRMEQPRDLVHGRAHAGDVRGRGERADAHAPLVRGVAQQPLEMREVDAAVRREIDFDDGGEPLAPGDFVRVVLVRAHEHDGLLRLLEAAELVESRIAEEFAQLFTHGLARRRRQRDAEDLLQLVDRPGGARAAGDEPPARSGIDRPLDHALGVVQQPAHAAARQVVLGVGVGVDALQVLQVLLDEGQAAPRGRVVAVHHEPPAERGVEGRVDADDLAAQVFETPVPHGRIVDPSGGFPATR